MEYGGDILTMESTKQVENAEVEENVKIRAKNVSDEKVDLGNGRELEPGEEWETEKKNLVVDEGLKFLAEKFTSGFGRSQKIDHYAIGDDNSQTTAGMTSLQGNENLREHIADADIVKVANGETKLNCNVSPGQPANQPVQISEIGLFASTQGASDDFMFSRVGLGADEFPKTSDIEVRIEYQIGFTNQ